MGTRRSAAARAAAPDRGVEPGAWIGYEDGMGLPVREGEIYVESSPEPVPYRIVCVAAGMVEDAGIHAMAVSSCRMACLAADVMRGSLSPAALRRAMEPACLRRLETMAYLMDASMAADEGLRVRMRYLPVAPLSVSGMLVGPEAAEMAVHLMVAGQSYWSNLRFERRGSRWICSVADMG